MTDPTQTRGTIHTSGSIAAAVGGALVGPADLKVSNLAALDLAGPESLTFIRSHKFALAWPSSKAAAALVTRDIEVLGHDPARRALILVDDADLAMVKVLAMFAPPVHRPAPGIDKTAVVDPTARVAPTAAIGPFCVIGPRTAVGDGCVLHARITLGADVSVGPQTVLFPGVVVYDRCSIGAQSILHSNVSIGADGFGYRPDPSGRGLIKVPHIGTVRIGNQVEIGANSAVDRGKFGATTVGDGTKIDNLVQIGHNVQIGRCVIICGMAAIAGSAIIEDGVILAGHVGVADGLTVGAGSRILAMSGVMCNVPPGQTWYGAPAGPHKDQMRSLAALRKLSDHMRELKRQGRQHAESSPEHD